MSYSVTPPASNGPAGVHTVDGPLPVTRVGINGFGRIGRQLFRLLWERYPELQVAAIGVRDTSKLEVRALLLERDSTYGRFPHTVEAGATAHAGVLRVDERAVQIIPRLDPHRTIGWGDCGVDIVIDVSGAGKRGPCADEHLREGPGTVIITCPTDWADVTIVYGINQQDYDPRCHRTISSSSCTTTCLAPVARVLDDEFGLAEGFVTTVHAFTNSQNLMDSTHKDPRRARAAGANIIPTTTGAASALDRVLPGLGCRLGAASLRVPVSTVSMIDLIARLEWPATPEEVNAAFRRAAAGPLFGILGVSDRPLVSSDYIGDDHSAVVDALSTSGVGQLVRVVAWYDNEWGYSCRVADLAAHVARQSMPRAVPAMAGVAPLPALDATW